MSYCIAQGNLLNVRWQPGWEGSLEENVYMYMLAESLHVSPETITTLLVNWLYPNKKKLKQRNETNPLK